MANITLGQLGPFLLTKATATQIPFTTPKMVATFPARSAFLMTGAPGITSVSGYARELGVPVIRRIIIMTQPPNAAVLYEVTTGIDGAFSFPELAAGNYLILDTMLDNSRQALVYDWVVSV